MQINQNERAAERVSGKENTVGERGNTEAGRRKEERGKESKEGNGRL